MQIHCYRLELRKVSTLALSLLMIGLLFSSCATRKDVAYVQTPEQVMTVASNGLQDARIRAKDLLTVTVMMIIIMARRPGTVIITIVVAMMAACGQND